MPKLIIESSTNNDTYILFFAGVTGIYVLFILTKILIIKHKIKLLLKAQKMIKKGHERYDAAKYFGDIDEAGEQKSAIYMNHFPDYEDRKFLMSNIDI